MTAALLRVRDLRTEFATRAGVARAVDGVSFDVHAGEIVGLVGESGSGKSVTGYSILGLIDPPGRIAGARKKLQQEIKDGFRPRSERREEVIVTPTPAVVSHTVVEPARNSAPMLFDAGFKRSEPVLEPPLPFDIPPVFDGDQHEAIKSLAQNLLELREILKPKPVA